MVEGRQRSSGARAHGDDDLLEGNGSHVPGGKYTRYRRGTTGIDLDLAEAGQLDLAVLQPVGVGNQTDLDEDTRHIHLVAFAGLAIGVGQTHHLAAITTHFSGSGVHDDLDVRQRTGLALQDLIGTQGVAEFQHGHMLDDTGQVDGRLDTGVATTDHRHTLALEQRAVTVRAVGHALAAVFLLAGHVHFAPAGTGGQDHRLAAQGSAAGQLDLDQAIAGQFGRALLGDHVNIVFLDVLLQAGDQFRAFGVGHGDEVLDTDSIHHLTTETLSHHTGTDALACGVDRGRGTGRATADYQYFVGLTLVQLGRFLLGGAGIQLVVHLRQRDAALSEVLAVQVGRRDGDVLAFFALLLAQRTVEHGVGVVRFHSRSQENCPDVVQAVLARQRD